MAAVALIEAFEVAGRLGGAESDLFQQAATAIERCALALDDKEICLGAQVGFGSVDKAVSEDGYAPEALEANLLGGAGDAPSVVQRLPPLFALWKPPGWRVAVGGGPSRRTSEETSGRRGAPARGRPLEEWLSYHLPDQPPIVQDSGAQHGFLHRLDIETSGVLCCAASYRGYYLGLLQFVSRQVRKAYLCLCHGHVSAGLRYIEAPLLTAALWPGGPLRSHASDRGRPARTELRSVAHLAGADGSPFTLLRVRLHTGRTHQIRAHLGSQGHPLAGDPAYGGAEPAAPWCPRVFLHASRLVLDVGDGPFDVRSPLPHDLCCALAELAAVGQEPRAALARGLAA